MIDDDKMSEETLEQMWDEEEQIEKAINGETE